MSDIIFRVVIPDQKILLKTLMLKGDRGAQGVSIISIEKTSTVGLVDTYTITMNDGTTYTFEVKNGANAYCDNELSLESENAVQNKVITAVINTINATLVSIQEYDNSLSLSSSNAVKNSVITAALDALSTAISNIQNYDTSLSLSSTNAVQNGVITEALNGKADSDDLNNYYPKSDIDDLFNNLGASSIDYNNEDSGLQATDVQAAIDELASDNDAKQDSLTAGDNVQIVNNVISATDTKPSNPVYDNTPAAVSIPSSTNWQAISQTPFLQVGAGEIWIFQIALQFPSNTNGFRSIGVSSVTDTAPSVIFQNTVAPANGAATNLTFTSFVATSSNTNYYIMVRQNSGSALNVTYRFRADRIR